MHRADMSNLSPLAPDNPGTLERPGQPSLVDYERSMQQCDEKRLWSMLQEIQGRLGTPTEEPDDLEKARAIAHRLSNILTAIRLKTELALLHQLQGGPGLMQGSGTGAQMLSDCSR